MSIQITASTAQLVSLLARDEGLVDQLVALTRQRSTQPRQQGARQTKISGSATPWLNREAEATLDYLAGAVRTAEAELRSVANIPLRHQRGLTITATKQSLRSLPLLADNAGGDWPAKINGHLTQWISRVYEVGDLDPQERWSKPPRQPGRPAPTCPYCGLYSLKISRSLGVLRCTNPECHDQAGQAYEWTLAELAATAPLEVAS